jgi:hypothetical protein
VITKRLLRDGTPSLLYDTDRRAFSASLAIAAAGIGLLGIKGRGLRRQEKGESPRKHVIGSIRLARPAEICPIGAWMIERKCGEVPDMADKVIAKSAARDEIADAQRGERFKISKAMGGNP